MNKKSVCTAILTMFASTMLLAASSTPEAPHVVNVLVFDVGANLAKFREVSQRAQSIGEKYGSAGKARIWMSQFAGNNTGTVVVVVEYPNLTAMAQSMSKVNTSPEWRQLVADVQGGGIKLLSNSVLMELPPQ
jgi:hypothetical protein